MIGQPLSLIAGRFLSLNIEQLKGPSLTTHFRKPGDPIYIMFFLQSKLTKYRYRRLCRTGGRRLVTVKIKKLKNP